MPFDTNRDPAEVLHFLESMDRVTRAMQVTSDLEEAMGAVLELVLEFLESDRAYLVYPCDPTAASWHVEMERTRPEYPGALAERGRHDIPMDEGVSQKLAALLASTEVLRFGPATGHPLPTRVSEQYGFQSLMAVALRPRVGLPWEFGVHQCSYARTWSESDARVLQEIAHRLSDGLSTLLTLRMLKQSEQRLRSFFDTAHVGMGEMDEGGRFVRVNDALSAMLGYSRDELLTLSAPQLAFPEDEAEVARNVQQMSLGPRDLHQVERRYRRKDGTALWSLAHVVVMERDERGRAMGASVVMVDVTERRRLEADLRQVQKMEAIGQLAGGVAHDFNNLLTVILSSSELLQTPDLDPVERAETVQQIQDAGERARDLTRQLLAFARKQVTRPVPLDLLAVVRSAEKLLRRLVGEDVTVEVEVEAPANLFRVLCDAGQFEQVLMNLAVNARDAMPHGGTLTLALANAVVTSAEATSPPPGDWVRLTVKDTGTGLTEAARAHLFEPFFTTKALGRGTGLGLATVHGIVAQAGGHIQAESEEGRGTAFTLWFPRSQQVPTAAGLTRAQTRARGGAETILVVEDDEMVRQVTVRSLGTANYRVLVASSGAEALAMVESEPRVDLLLSDIVMPGLSGPALAARLSSQIPGLRVLLVSGHAQAELSRRGVQGGDWPLLQKPFTPSSLLDAVRAVLDAPPPHSRGADAAEPA
jgi:PAS domain S-box-containing protein